MEGSSELHPGPAQPSPVKVGRVWSKEARSMSPQGWSEGGSEEAWPNSQLWDRVRATAGAQGGWQGTLESPWWKVKIIMPMCPILTMCQALCFCHPTHNPTPRQPGPRCWIPFILFLPCIRVSPLISCQKVPQLGLLLLLLLLLRGPHPPAHCASALWSRHPDPGATQLRLLQEALSHSLESKLDRADSA